MFFKGINKSVAKKRAYVILGKHTAEGKQQIPEQSFTVRFQPNSFFGRLSALQFVVEFAERCLTAFQPQWAKWANFDIISIYK
jgi:hypothetical protein